jgi:Na+/glutamate symporter
MDFSNSNTVLWKFIVQMGMLAAILLLSNFMRRNVPVVKKALMPTAVLAGFLTLFCDCKIYYKWTIH